MVCSMSGVALFVCNSLASLIKASRTVAMVSELVVLMPAMALGLVASVLLQSRPVVPYPNAGL